MTIYTEKSALGQINLDADNRHVPFPGNLNMLEKEYDNLLRVDKSSLVNVAKIVSYEFRKRTLHLEGGIDCNVSFRKSSDDMCYPFFSKV
ncbi:LytTR family transcriptional regulator DNA-binding domain-containing protein [Companilactobacillus nantensis]|uniref:LytTR family transcriptional regulator DNA-binding domain-containing protein n=1 Tax=Companilactobacillus nantensis TaxID=305793 RepID=UPI00118F4F9A|nr:LytTR family transcriptional regulator DNA-binding domain-containing protein [Companilactobacillus nantensis]GEO65232.1 hypothetical protein LNA01_24150 [Companilactobacillus nantensis]